MNTLASLQRDFQRALTGGNSKVWAQLSDGASLDADLGLNIYVHAYSARLREALQNDHAQLAAYLGDELWDALAREFIAAHPSHQTSLRHFGDALPDFLRRTPRFATHPVLAELAAFERALLDSFDAAEAPVASWQNLLDTPPSRWPQLRPSFAPCLGRLGLRLNAVEIWQALKSGHRPPAAISSASDWVVWRDAEQITRFRSLELEEAVLLDHFLAGGNFAGACDQLQRWHPAGDVPALALQALGRWCGEGWLRAWEAPTR